MERLDALENEQRDILAGFRVNHAFAAHKELEKEWRQFQRSLMRGGRDDAPDSEALLAAMFALGDQFGKKVS